MRHLSLYLGLFWLFAGTAMLAHDWATGGKQFRILGTDLSLGWICLVLAAYNLVRWYYVRSSRRDLGSAEDEFERRREALRRRRQPAEPDRTFDFSDRPPEPPVQRPDDRPS
jgi:hypothetical protein